MGNASASWSFFHGDSGSPFTTFVRGLLYAYGIQIHDLTPNSILSITSFIVLCECFLGIAPHWALWKSLFQVRRMVGKSKETYPVGGFGIQLRGDTVFFHMKKSDSVQNWRKKWFYVKWNQAGLPDFAADRPLKKTKAWSHPLSAEEKESIKPLTSLLRGLLKSMGREAGGIQLIAMFHRLRIQPLQQRPLPMWEMAVDPAVDDAQVAIKVRNSHQSAGRRHVPLDLPSHAVQLDESDPRGKCLNLDFFFMW